MKKILLLMITAVVLVACSDNNEKETQKNDNEKANTETTNNVIPDNNDDEIADEIDVKFTSDPMEAGNKASGIEMFVDDFDYIYSIIDWYTNDDTNSDGFNTMEFEGYKVTYAVVLLMDEEGNDVIGFFAETENGTEYVVQYNMDFEIITNESEQLDGDSMYGIGETKPGIKTKGFVKDTLEYDVPTKLDITFFPPWDAVDEFNAEIGQPIKVSFTKE